MSDTILIVEDEQDVLDLVAYNLRKAGYHTVAARDGAAGLTKARDLLPALLILDLMLPDLPGVEIMKKLRAQPAEE